MTRIDVARLVGLIARVDVEEELLVGMDEDVGVEAVGEVVGLPGVVGVGVGQQDGHRLRVEVDTGRLDPVDDRLPVRWLSPPGVDDKVLCLPADQVDVPRLHPARHRQGHLKDVRVDFRDHAREWTPRDAWL